MAPQATTQLLPNQKIRVNPTAQGIAVKGTPELKTKGIIIANNKQVSNFTKPTVASQ